MAAAIPPTVVAVRASNFRYNQGDSMSYENKAAAELAAVTGTLTDDQRIKVAQVYALLQVSDQLKSVRAVLDNFVANQRRKPC